MKINEKIRVLGKGLTAQAIKDKFPNAILYDDSDFDLYDLESNERTIVSPGIPPFNKMILWIQINFHLLFAFLYYNKKNIFLNFQFTYSRIVYI